MAVTQTYTGDMGQREDLSDLIYNISPTATPLMSAVGVTDASATLHEWLEDVLTAPAVDNAVQEGADAPAASASNTPTRLNNNTQISQKTYGVSGTLEVVSKAGRDSDIAYRASKAARELKTDVEATILKGNQVKTVAASGTAPLSASLNCWLDNAAFATGGTPAGANPTAVAGANRPTYDGTGAAFTQAKLDDVIQQCWSEGGQPSLIIIGPNQKEVLSSMDGIGNTSSGNITRSDRASRTIIATADVYVSNFGSLSVVPSRMNRQGVQGVAAGGASASVDGERDSEVYVIDPEYLKLAYLRPWQEYELSKVGDSISRQMLVEWTLEVCNRNAHGIIRDLT
tara:strand:+ start:7826 stop:8851 length:1026 start_codon:yes stop_codon:yes gene_type:complete